MDNKTEEWEAQAWEDLHRADEETLKNLKANEALFDGMVYYTKLKEEVDEITAIVSIDSDTKLINILWTESDEEIIEDYVESKIDEIPAGTFFIKFWCFDEKTSYEYDEWDTITSVNYEIIKYSDLNFEKTLKKYAEYEKEIKNVENIIAELEKTQTQYNAVVNQNKQLQEELRPFRHEYFKALDTKTIAELAKKSIKITTLNIKLEELLDYIYKQACNATTPDSLRLIWQAIDKYRGVQ